jgi:hypothetical protein
MGHHMARYAERQADRCDRRAAAGEDRDGQVRPSPRPAGGRLRPIRTVEQAAEESGFLDLPVPFRRAQRVGDLPPHHRDPFDRLLSAQACIEELTLVTRDVVFAGYGVGTIEA